MITFFAVFFLSFALISFYILRRMWQSLESTPKWFRYTMSGLFLFMAVSYPLAKGLLNGLNNFVYDIVLYIGAFGFAIIVYALLFLFIIDIGRFILKKSGQFKKLQNNYPRNKLISFMITLLLITIIVTAGEINADDIIVNEIPIKISKNDAPYKNLKLVFFSDLHLSPLNDERQLEKIIKLTQDLDPDIIIMGGDIVDDNEANLYRDNVQKLLKQISAPKGIYTILGNHEYIVEVENSIKILQKCGVEILRDEKVIIDDFVQIVGRDDLSKERFRGEKRKELRDLLAGLDSSKPVILVDHQPYNLRDVTNFNVDLQLSGHTHHGQLFPGNLITSIIYEVSYGLKKIEDTYFYVSSGVGTWGPPVRTGSKSEVVLFNIAFE